MGSSVVSVFILSMKYMKLLTSTTVEMSDPSWISYKKGEILFTDGVIRAAGPSEL